MRVLLDTHVFLWWINDDPRLSDHARTILRSADNTLHFSAASGWEMAIKVRTGKLELPAEPVSFIVRELHHNQIRPFPIQLRHALHTYVLPMLHRDPFDRMLIAQSQLESLPILTVDRAITQYAVDTIW
jgi:PIN domain nuclease of toxin-antitoxin system